MPHGVRAFLKPNGYCLVMWNVRKTAGTPFLEAYESLLLKYGTDYSAVCHTKNIDATILREFFANGYEEAKFPNQQRFDLEGVIGRCNSSQSYAPAPGQPKHEPLMHGLRDCARIRPAVSSRLNMRRNCIGANSIPDRILPCNPPHSVFSRAEATASQLKHRIV